MSDELHIAPVARTDLHAVYRIFRAATPDRPDCAKTGFLLSQYDRDGFWRFLDERIAYVARSEQTPVGFCVIARPTEQQMQPVRWSAAPIVDDGSLLWIKMVAILPAYKRRGVASALYRHLFRTFPTHAFITGLYEQPLDNRASRHFHRALDFQRVGEIRHIGLDATLRVTGIFYRPARSDTQPAASSEEVRHVL